MEDFKDIWFVDDNEVFRFIIKSLMEDSDHTDRIAFFDDGDRALMRLIELHKTRNKGPKIIFLDIYMKRVDGWDFIRDLKELDLNLNIVLLTTETAIKHKARADQENLVKGYLTKPVNLSQIEEYIERLAPKQVIPVN